MTQTTTPGGQVERLVNQMNSVEVGETPSDVVYSENKLDLLHYEPRTKDQEDVPILITYALINKPYILDLQPDRSVVRTLLDQGMDVYLIRWGEPSRLDAHLTLDDYVNRYIHNCLQVVCDRSGVDAVTLLGYCMGGTLSAMYASQHPENVRNLILMAAGLSFSGDGGILELWGDRDHFKPEELTNTFGNVPAEFLAGGFDLLEPVNNLVTKYRQFCQNADNEEFVENFARMEKWIEDGVDLAGDAFVQFIRSIYQENRLINNEMELDGKPVDIQNITMPVLQLVAEHDHLIPPEASIPFNEEISSDDTEIFDFPVGHIGLSVSSSSHEDLWPEVCNWIRERS